MKIAAVRALQELAKEEVPDDVKSAYGGEDFTFGKNYLIPKPFDKRVLTRVSPAVAKAGMESGVARVEIKDFNQYALQLEARMGQADGFMRSIRSRLDKDKKKKVVFAEGANGRILQAVSILVEEGKIEPILLGNPETINGRFETLGLSHLKDKVEIIRPVKHENFRDYYFTFHEERKRRGATLSLSEELMKAGNYYGSMMVKKKHADAMITGTTQNYPDCFTPIMRVSSGGTKSAKVAGVMILVFKTRVLFLADCTAQQNPSAEDLAHIAESATNLYKQLMQKDPAVAFLSYSNFGSNINDESKKIINAVQIVKEKMPTLMVDGEMQADVAVNEIIRSNLFKFSSLTRPADLLIFPDLQSANISYKLLSQLSECTAIGPILAPMDSPMNIVQRTSSVEEIINITHLTALLSDLKK
jgi:malate dehydrogenase (oxaloacetate-decarboxylating)(NADP+)